MTPYIQQQLKKLCDNPNWYDDILILIRNEDIYQAHKHTHPNKQNKVYNLTATSPNNIHHSPDNIIPHIKVPGINTGYLPHYPTQK